MNESKSNTRNFNCDHRIEGVKILEEVKLTEKR